MAKHRIRKHVATPLPLAISTHVADSTAPRDPRFRGNHYRNLFVDAHRVIDVLQLKISSIEAEREAIRRQREYDRSLTITRTEAEQGRLSAFRLAREKAARLMEGPDGEPTSLSEAIRDIPDIRPKWSNN